MSTLGLVLCRLPSLTTFTPSTLGNLSDRSFISRLDYSLTVFTHLSFEAFAGVHYGKEGGEFRFTLPGSALPGGWTWAWRCG